MQLRRRRFGDIVRLEVDAGAPAELVDLLERELRAIAEGTSTRAALRSACGALESSYDSTGRS